MAADTKYGANYTKALITKPSEKINRGDVSGELVVAYDQFTFPEELEVGDLIYVCPPIPAGAMVVDATVILPNLGATGILDLGSASDQDSLVSQADGGGQAAYAKPGVLSADVGRELAADTQFMLKCTEVSTAATGLTAKVMIVYRDV